MTELPLIIQTQAAFPLTVRESLFDGLALRLCNNGPFGKMPPIAFYGWEYSGLIFFSPVRFKPGLILAPQTNLSGPTVCSKLAKEAATHPGKAIRIG